MEIILLQRVEKLGQMGDVVRVKDGYARNYLLPQKKALRATEDNLRRFEHQRTELEARNLEHRKEAEALAPRVAGLTVVMLRQASEGAQLYGSVSARDIAEAVSGTGFAIDRRQVQLAAPIKILGIHPVAVALHPEVSVTINVNIARTEEDAELQAKAGEAATIAEAAEGQVGIERFFEEEALEEAEQEIAATRGEPGAEAPSARERRESGEGAPGATEPAEEERDEG